MSMKSAYFARLSGSGSSANRPRVARIVEDQVLEVLVVAGPVRHASGRFLPAPQNGPDGHGRAMGDG